MKKGDLIGIGGRGSKEVDLLCEVESYDGQTLNFFVLNGAWDGRLYADGKLEAMFPNGAIATTTPGAAALYTGPIRRKCRDYNDAIDYMNEQLKRWRITRWWGEKCWRLGEVRDRFQNASRAFCDVWQGKTPKHIEDTIPF